MAQKTLSPTLSSVGLPLQRQGRFLLLAAESLDIVGGSGSTAELTGNRFSDESRKALRDCADALALFDAAGPSLTAVEIDGETYQALLSRIDDSLLCLELGESASPCQIPAWYAQTDKAVAQAKIQEAPSHKALPRLCEAVAASTGLTQLLVLEVDTSGSTLLHVYHDQSVSPVSIELAEIRNFRVGHVCDLQQEMPSLCAGDEASRRTFEAAGARSLLVLPLQGGERCQRYLVALNREVTPLTLLALFQANRLARELSLQCATGPCLAESILESLPHIVVATAPDGTVTYLNRATELAYGYKAEEIVGKSTPLIWHDPEEIAEGVEMLSKELGRPVESPFELFISFIDRYGVDKQYRTFVRKDGSKFPAWLVACTIKDEFGKVVGYVGVLEDIAEQRRSRLVSGMVKTTLENAADCLSLEELLNTATRTICEAMDWPVAQAYTIDQAEGVLRSNGLHFVTNGNWDTNLASRQDIVELALKEERVCIFDVDDTHALYALPILSNGKVKAVLKFLGRDWPSWNRGLVDGLENVSSHLSRVLERIEVVEEIAESRAFLELINQHNPDYVFVKDSEFRIVQANPAFLSLYSADSRDEIIGHTTVEAFSEAEAQVFLEHDRVALENGRSEALETIAFPNGETKVLKTKKVRFEDRRGNTFVLGISRDQTKEERLIERLSLSNEELERFAFVCSHDLQEPVRMVRSFSEMLQEHLGEQLAEDEQGKLYLQFITEGAARAQALIKDVLALCKLQSDTKPFRDVDTGQLVEQIVSEAQESLASGKGQVWYQNLPSVQAVDSQLYQLFQNLINNGLKYQPAGRVPTIRIEAVDQGTHWQFSVADNGIGIPQRHQERIFEVFRRLHSSSQYPGTGIGLAICRKVVERHGGKIWVESQPDQGSTFRFTLAKSPKERTAL